MATLKNQFNYSRANDAFDLILSNTSLEQFKKHRFISAGYIRRTL